MSLALHRRPVAALGAGLLAVLALGACSSTESRGSSAGAVSSAVAPADPEMGAPEADAQAPDAASDGQPLADPSTSGGAAAGSSSSAKGSSPASPADIVAAEKLVRTASLQVQVDDVEAKAAQARQIAVAAGGTVLSENSSAVPANDGSIDKQGSRSSMTLAVPSDTLDRVVDDLGKLGTTVQRASSARDVTSTYVDTQSRIATMKAGLDQLRTLLGKATDLNQIVSLETEIARRQADLDSLQAQLNALDKKVAMATVTATLVTAANVVVPEEDGTGFLGGLKAGWKAFLGASSSLLTVVGAILPFVVLLLLLAAPVVWWRRRRSTPQSPQTGYASWAPPPSGSGGAGGGSGPEEGPNGPGGSDGGTSGPGGPDQGAAQNPSTTSERSPQSGPTAGSEAPHGESGAGPVGGGDTGQREPETAGTGAR